ncbi:hypothetical protein C0J52_28176, partial [Blattella germanica]
QFNTLILGKLQKQHTKRVTTTGTDGKVGTLGESGFGVYTVNNESQHVLVCGVPALGLQDDLRRLCARFGDVKSLVFVPKYAEEEFTDVYHVQYARIQSARYAKHHLDGREFFGGILHVCYVPEMESLAETRAKLIQRRKEVARRTRNDGSKCPEQSKWSSRPLN